MKRDEFTNLKAGDFLWSPENQVVMVVKCYHDIDLNETPPKRYTWAVEVTGGRQIRLFDNLLMWGLANSYVERRKKNQKIQSWVHRWVNSLDDEQIEDMWFRATMVLYAHKDDTWADVKEEVRRADLLNDSLRGKLTMLLTDWLESDGPAVTYYGRRR